MLLPVGFALPLGTTASKHQTPLLCLPDLAARLGLGKFFSEIRLCILLPFSTCFHWERRARGSGSSCAQKNSLLGGPHVMLGTVPSGCRPQSSENPSDKPVQPPSALHVPRHLALSSGSQPCQGRGETEAKSPVKGGGWSQVRAQAVCGGPGS